MPRQLKSLGGSTNELEEIQLIIHERNLKKTKQEQLAELTLVYGGPIAKEIMARREEMDQAQEAEDVSVLEARVKEEREHNERFKKEVEELYKKERRNNMISKEEMGWDEVTI